MRPPIGQSDNFTPSVDYLIVIVQGSLRNAVLEFNTAFESKAKPQKVSAVMFAGFDDEFNGFHVI